MKRVLVLACVTALAACGGEQHSDLKKELNEMTKDLRGRVDPLPQVRPYEPVPYQAENEIDPFRPSRIDVATAGGGGAPTAGGKHPDFDREGAAGGIPAGVDPDGRLADAGPGDLRVGEGRP